MKISGDYLQKNSFGFPTKGKKFERRHFYKRKLQCVA
jgi:hypothetical protein